MRRVIRPLWWLSVLGLVAAGSLASLYVSTLGHLTAARTTRQDDDCAAAERQLAKC